MSLYVSNIVCNSASIAGGTCITDTSTNTLTNKTINSIDNTVQVDGIDINDLIDQSVKQMADVSFQTISSVGTTTSGGNLTSQGTLIVTGPKISPLPTTSQLTAGLDTLGNPRLQFWGDPANPIGSLTFGNLAGTSQYEGKIDYDGPTDTFGFYTAGSATPIVNITPSAMSIGSAEVATTTNSLVFSNKTIDSSANTIQISNSPLSAANINTLINQPLLTSSSVVFANLTATQTNPFISISDLSRNGLLGISSNANAWFSGSSTGDFCISNRTNGNIRLGFGTGASAAPFILNQTTGLTVNNTITCPWIESSSTVSIARGANNITGTGGTISVAGTPFAHTITLTTGATGIVTVGIMFTVTFSTAAPDALFSVVVQPTNANSASRTSDVYVTNLSSSSYAVSNITTNLTPSTAYTWSCIAMS